MKKVIQLQQIKKVFQMEEIRIQALKGIDLEVEKGEFVAVIGASESGKSTCMNISGCLDRDFEGSYYLDGVNVKQLPANQLADIRNDGIMELLQKLNEEGKTILIVTHEQDIAEFTKRKIVFRDGKIIKEELYNKQKNAMELLKELNRKGGEYEHS